MQVGVQEKKSGGKETERERGRTQNMKNVTRVAA